MDSRKNLKRSIHIPVTAIIVLIVAIIGAVYVFYQISSTHSKVTPEVQKRIDDIISVLSANKIKIALVYSKLSQQEADRPEAGAGRATYMDSISLLKTIYEGYGFEVDVIALDDRDTTPQTLATYEFIVVWVPIYSETDVQKMIQYFKQYNGKAVVYFPSFYITTDVNPSSTLHELFGVLPGAGRFDPRALIVIGGGVPEELICFNLDQVQFRTIEPVKSYIPLITLTKGVVGPIGEAGSLAYVYADVDLPSSNRYIPIRLPLITYKSAGNFKVIYVNFHPISMLKAKPEEVSQVHNAVLTMIYHYFLT